VRRELGVITYASNFLRARGPRRMNVGIPQVNKRTEDAEVWVEQDGGAKMMSVLKGKSSGRGKFLHEFVNKYPRWNSQVGAYVLNFNGRVTMASVKNFQMVDPEEQETVMLQFGRVGEDEFTMDFSHPFSPFQAFSICLTSFDSKIACD